MALKRTAFATLTLLPLIWHSGRAWASDLQQGEAAYDAGQFQKADRLLSKAAEKGDARAAFDLGLLHDLGQGVPEDAAIAFRWYRRAAEEGLAEAQFNVGVMYDSGRGVARSEARAAIWYARAGIQGNGRAAFNLGQLYDEGQGVPRNAAMAAAWYRLAAATVPAAAQRVAEIAAPVSKAAAGPLLPAIPAWPRRGAALPSAKPDQPAQLVWSAPPEPGPVIYFIEVRSLAKGRSAQIASGYSPVSAVAVTLPAQGTYAWRVYAVAADGSSYVAGSWALFGSKTDLPAAARLPGQRHP